MSTADPRLDEWQDVPFDPTWPFVIYRLYDADDRCIYVGMTSQRPQVRVEQHRRHQPWGKQIARAECAVIRKGDPVKIEMDEIARANPLYNKVRP